MGSCLGIVMLKLNVHQPCFFLHTFFEWHAVDVIHAWYKRVILFLDFTYNYISLCCATCAPNSQGLTQYAPNNLAMCA